MKQLLNFIFPKLCFSCSSGLEESKKFICSMCINELRHLTEFERFNYLKKNLSPEFSKCFIAFRFDEQSRVLLHLLKYKYLKPLGYMMGELIYHEFSDFLTAEQFSVIIPCPLHKRKQMEREYNQSELIAKAMSDLSGIPLDTKSLARVRYTKTQTRLNKKNREKNLVNSFIFEENEKIKKVFLVDDVITTGATIKMMAKAVHQVNPKIVCIAIAFASPIQS